MRTNEFEHRFVNRVPEILEEGVLYVCLECNLIVHLCACGCKEKVVIIIDPEHWQLRYDGEGISINPSIGNYNFACQSHYFVKKNKVMWIEDTEHSSKKREKKKRNLLLRLLKLI